MERTCHVGRHGKLWKDKYRKEFLPQMFLKSCLKFLTPLYKKEFPCWYTLLTQTCFSHMESGSCFLSVQNSFLCISRNTSQSFTFQCGVKQHAIFRKKELHDTTFLLINDLLVCTNSFLLKKFSFESIVFF